MGKHERREMRMVKAADIAELCRMVSEYQSKPAIIEIINRQQQGKGLRYYPDGRRGVDDDGFMPVYVANEDGVALIRFGRPNKCIKVTKDLAFTLITCISRCALGALSWHLDNDTEDGDPAEDIYEAESRMEDLVLDLAEGDFEYSLEWTNENEDEPIMMTLKPTGAHTWYLSLEDCAGLVRGLCESCKARGWVYDKEISEEDMNFVEIMLDRS